MKIFIKLCERPPKYLQLDFEHEIFAKQINLFEKNIFDPRISCQDKDLQKAHMYWNERSE